MQQLSKYQRQQISSDRRILADRGLKMPRLTKKYLTGIFVLAIKDQTSPYFFHLHAARHGREIIYHDLAKSGYLWNGQDWILSKLP